jgi:hypothetical protein
MILLKECEYGLMKVTMAPFFFNFVPAEEKSWKIDAKKSAEFKYRIILTDSTLASKKINEQWIKYSK